jgi:D-beta-D-heptose 7-phosphate kinase/D-beta-D-heptose 1-phosphate adenosyltransferase
MHNDLSHWVRSARGRRVLLVGDLILDRYVYGDAERISPEAPVPVLRATETREAVGGSANVAACLRALGCDVVCCGAIGDDRHGRTLSALLESIGVDVSGLLRHPDRPTTTKTRLVGLAQHRHRQQLLRLDEEDATPIDGATAKRLTDAVTGRIADCDVICVEDYDKGVVNAALMRAIVEEARRRGRPVLVDPARLTDYSRYADATLLTPNRDELSIAVGRRLESIEAVAAAAEALRQQCAAEGVVATVDRDGAVLVWRDRPWKHLATTPRTVYDNTGAGDAVLAMLAAAIAGGADAEIAARLANVAGGLEVEKFGCVPISAEEVLAELRISDRRRNGKLRSLEELLAELQLRCDRGETVAFTNGCYDILHAGHVDLLKRARCEASVLVVAVNSDASVRSLDKGADRPINALADRAALLGALECVDYVVAFDEPTPESLIRAIRPNVLVKGADWAGKEVVGQEFVTSIDGRVALMPLLEGRSTSALIERIRNGAARSCPTR